MSWVEWLGRREPITTDAAEISLFLWPANSTCPRQAWTFSLSHGSSEPSPDDSEKPWRELSIELSELHFAGPDWRELSGREIHATPAWQDQHEYCTEYGQIARATVELRITDISRREDGTKDASHATWVGEDFHLRFGKRDGHCFPCELDAWLLPDKEWERTAAESPEELARTAQGPPNLRMIVPAYFSRAEVQMPRCGLDPVPLAAIELERAIGNSPLVAGGFNWEKRLEPGNTVREMVGWTSTVWFGLPK